MKEKGSHSIRARTHQQDSHDVTKYNVAYKNRQNITLIITSMQKTVEKKFVYFSIYYDICNVKIINLIINTFRGADNTKNHESLS